MTTYNTGNALGSADARDLYDNAENIDNFANGSANAFNDRLGVSRKSIAGMENAFDAFVQSSGYTVPVAYTSGIVLSAYNQLIEYNNEFYKLKAGQSPYTTTGTWGTDSAKLVSVGDAALRQELAAGDGASKVGYQLAGGVARNVDDKLSEFVSVKDFGAVGDGVAGDTAAILTAIQSGAPLDFGRGRYRVTSSIAATVAKVNWRGDGAEIIYDGPQIKCAVDITCGINAQHTVEGIAFDGGNAAHVAASFVAATVSEPFAQWPNISLKNIVCRKVFRASLDIPGGDGLLIAGGFASAKIDGIRVHDVYMAVGAGVLGSQGITGISFVSNGSRRPRHIVVENYDIRNVWSLDPSYVYDQDGIRVFQEAGERTSTCFILNGSIINNGGRAIKLHSGTNAVVNGLYREKNSSVIPQSGLNTNPDIDAQQAPANISNIRFHYDGVWHQEIVRALTVRIENYDYGGCVVSKIAGRIRNAAANTIRVVGLAFESGVLLSDYRATISDISIDGEVASFVSVSIAGTSGGAGVNTVALSNAIAKVNSEAIRVASETARLRVSVSNIHNTNASSPVALSNSMATGDRVLNAVNVSGFSSIGANNLFGIDSGANVYGTFDSARIGATFMGFEIKSYAGVSDTDVIVLLQPYADIQSHTSGVIHLYRGTATSAGGGTVSLMVAKDASTGDPAFYCTYNGFALKTASLVRCTYAGVERIGVRLSGGGPGLAFSRAFFNGNYLGSQPTSLVPASAVTGITDLAQRSGFETASAFLNPVRLPSYSKTALPLASAFVRCQIWVSDAAGGAQPAYSDGTNWRRYSDGAIVS